LNVQVQLYGSQRTGLAIAGPRARDLLQELTDTDLSNEALPFMGIQPMAVGLANTLVGRVSFTGDLGYEIWMTPDLQCHVFDQLMQAGEKYGIRLFGLRALNALRLEKNYGGWAREYRPSYSPYESGLGRASRRAAGH